MSREHYPYVWLGEDGILRIDYGRHGRIDLSAIQSAYAQHMAITRQPLPVLIVGSGAVSSTSEAEDYANGPEVSAVTLALALVVSSPLMRLAAKLYLTYRKPPYPCRAFEDEAGALRWLSSYVPAGARQAEAATPCP
ncbi:hypothetical protein [Chitinimonas sp.]|uniref:DUF7793 family protein n=1 Tax=Chitinimonas sp. TaxID=1934313 RepID=UPI002F94CE25